VSTGLVSMVSGSGNGLETVPTVLDSYASLTPQGPQSWPGPGE